jgi:anthranilate phosphoribosyltransferase
MIAGKVQSLSSGVSLAWEMIDSGKAHEKLKALKEITNRQV